MSGPRKPFISDSTSLSPSSTPSRNSGGTAHILPAERDKCTFDIETMTYFLDGGKKQTLRRRFIAGSTEDLPSAASKFDLDRHGAKGSIAENFLHFMKIHEPHFKRFVVPKDNDMLYMSMGQTMGGYPGYGLFLTTILTQSSPEQLTWWMPKAYNMQITGSYCQTELGHGSNVRGLETTARYDLKSHEFILNTDTLTSMKWWPSSLATATHCALYAQLLIGERNYGLHVFFVQLRDENLEPLPGIEIGDLGTKAGENEVDIGYLRLTDVRIPRRHMFERKSHVEPDGTYVLHAQAQTPDADSDLTISKQVEDKSHYLTMMTARVMLVATASVFLAKGSTIAVRYNCVRTQGFKSHVETDSVSPLKAEEYAIIDYKMNQYTLFKYLALAFAIRTTSNWLTAKLAHLQQNMGADNAGEQIQELHASAAGLKGFCCNETAIGLEEIRKTCGGAGYLMASGIAGLVSDYKWRATAEGDTNVMLLQTARYLIKNSRLHESTPSKPQEAKTIKEYLNMEYLLSLFNYRTWVQVSILRQTLEKKMHTQKLTYDQAWGALTLKAVRVGESHVVAFLLEKFYEMVQSCEDKKCREALYDMCLLLALSNILDGQVQTWSNVFDLKEAQIELIETCIDAICEKVRPNAVGLVDAWDFHDKTLNSTIGRYDGNVYEAQYKSAVESPMNKYLVPEYFEVYKPFLDMDFLKRRNKLVDDTLNPDDCSSYPNRPNSSKL